MFFLRKGFQIPQQDIDFVFSFGDSCKKEVVQDL